MPATGGAELTPVALTAATATTATAAAVAKTATPAVRRRRAVRMRVTTASLGTPLGGGGSATSCWNLYLSSSVIGQPAFRIGAVRASLSASKWCSRSLASPRETLLFTVLTEHPMISAISASGRSSK